MKKCLASGHHNGILRVFQQWKETALSWSLRNNFSLKVQPLRPNLPSETLPTPSLCPNQTEQSELKVQPSVSHPLHVLQSLVVLPWQCSRGGSKGRKGERVPVAQVQFQGHAQWIRPLHWLPMQPLQLAM